MILLEHRQAVRVRSKRHIACVVSLVSEQVSGQECGLRPRMSRVDAAEIWESGLILRSRTCASLRQLLKSANLASQVNKPR